MALTITGLRNLLEVGTNIAILVVSIVLLSSFAISHFSTTEINRSLVTGLEKGQQLPRLADINYEPFSHTVLLALNTECGHCTNNISFYRRMASLAENGGSRIQIIAIFPNAENRVLEYVEQHGLNVPFRASVDHNPLNSTGTPAVIIVDRHGWVADFWVGEVPQESQDKIISLISSLQ